MPLTAAGAERPALLGGIPLASPDAFPRDCVELSERCRAAALAALESGRWSMFTSPEVERCEAELGEEQWSFIEGCPRDWGNLPIPDGPITVGIDGGYVRDWEAKKHNFEIIVGKSTLAFRRDEDDDIPSSKRFGFVQTLDAKPTRRLVEILQSQGMQLNQQITFLSDGSDTVRNLQLSMSPEAEHILDWHHVTMRLTVLAQYGKGLVHCDAVLGEEIREKIERLKWALWHGNLYKALYKIDDIASLIYNFEETYSKFKPLRKAVDEFRTYIRNNRHLIPNYGERYRNGEAIATGFVESIVNQVVSKRFPWLQSI